MASALFLLCLFSAEAAPTERVVSALLERAPRERWIGGGFSTVFGGMSATRGVLLMGDANSSQEEHIAGGLLFALGTVRLLDGVDRLVSASPWEQRAKELAQAPESVREQVSRLWLAESARESRRLKWIRSSLLAANGLVYLTLYQHNSQRNRGLLYPGITLMALAVFRALSATSAEAAWATVAAGPEGLGVSVAL